MNIGKYMSLIDHAERLHSDYRAAAERMREARNAAARLRANALTDPTNERAVAILALSADQLTAAKAEDIGAAGLSALTVRCIVEADRRALALTREAEAIAARLAPARALADRLAEHVRRVAPEVLA